MGGQLKLWDGVNSVKLCWCWWNKKFVYAEGSTLTAFHSTKTEICLLAAGWDLTTFIPGAPHRPLGWEDKHIPLPDFTCQGMSEAKSLVPHRVLHVCDFVQTSTEGLIWKLLFWSKYIFALLKLIFIFAKPIWVTATESLNAGYVLDRDSNLPITKVFLFFVTRMCVINPDHTPE